MDPATPSSSPLSSVPDNEHLTTRPVDSKSPLQHLPSSSKSSVGVDEGQTVDMPTEEHKQTKKSEARVKPMPKTASSEQPIKRSRAKRKATPKKSGGENRHEEDSERPSKKTKSQTDVSFEKTTAPPARTSTRNRKAPERFEDLEETPPTKASPVKKGTSKVFDPVFITTNSTSRLGKADMYHMLLEDTAWTSLSSEQQITLVSMLPDSIENQQLLTRIKTGETGITRPRAFTMSNNCFRTDVAKFQEDLKNGHLAKTWQAAAEQAVAERASGEYDAWKAEEAELWWGQKSQ
ncbi:hypothetical protein N0V94_003374 [Neodidymelliopsis sp. IMI 364377]|nr:hypothetical protein N0V94_003374 [Neodidymelliopsis sp. IMI 364377]